MTVGKAPRVELKPDVDRILAAIAYVISRAENRGRRPSQYEIAKTLFIADRAHLNKYGRPITFDNYFAMNHGPVPSFAYNLLKQDRGALKAIGERQIPWQQRSVGKHFEYFAANAILAEDALSESDIEELDGALSVILTLSFGQIRRVTHEDPAYQEAWSDEDDARAFPMSLGMLFDAPNYDAANTVAFISKHK